MFRNFTWNVSYLRLFTISVSSFLLVVLSSVFISLLISSSTHATSVYDNPNLVSSLSIDTGTCSRDFTADWFSETDAFFGDDLTEYLDPDEYQWGVLQQQVFAGSWQYGWSFIVMKKSMFQDPYTFGYQDSSSPTNPVIGAPFNMANYGGYHEYSVYVNNSTCEVQGSNTYTGLTCRWLVSSGCLDANWAWYANGVFSPMISGGQWTAILFMNMDFLPPTGYAGPTIPNTVDVPNEYQPDLEITSGDSKHISIHDNNFFTFDPVPFTCDDDLAPVMNWELWLGWDPDTDELIDSGQASPTVPWTYTVGNGGGDYTFTAWYDCGDGTVFTEVSFLYFTVAETPPSGWVPALNIVTASGYHLVIQDTNFNTFDPVPFTCDDELTPIMHYELYRKVSGSSDVLMDSGVISPTIQYTYTLPAGARDYAFVAWYDCAGEPVFSDSNVLDFTMNEYGSLVQACGSDIDGWYCSFGQSFSFGIISSTLNGLTGILTSISSINPTYCNTNWVSTIHFESDILPVQDMPQNWCDNAENLILDDGSPFYSIKVIENIVLSGGAVLLLVFGLLAIFGIKVRLPDPIGEGEGTVGSDIPTHPSVSRHRVPYVKGKK